METFYVTKVSGVYFKKMMFLTDLCLVYLYVMDTITQRDKFRWSKIFQYFLQGLLVIAPVAITLYTVYWIVSSIDRQIPIFTAKGEDGQIYVQNYGLGFLIVIVAICLIGYLSSFFIKNRVFNLFDGVLKRTPGIRFIYSTTKEFFEALKNDITYHSNKIEGLTLNNF